MKSEKDTISQSEKVTVAKRRDQTIDILKGIGIILMVIGHSGAPVWLHNTIYSFHMPLFFIASGWFFSEKYLDTPVDYTKRKFKGIYLPYLKWSLVFLILHNLFFYLGIINETYSEQTAFNLNEYVSHLCNIVFVMKGYDSLLGTYWFMRALLVGCLFLGLFSSLIYKVFKGNKYYIIIITSLLFFIIGAVVSFFQLRIPVIPHNGYREMLAAFFIGMGFWIRGKEGMLSRYSLLMLIILVLCILFHPTEMVPDISFYDWLVIPVAGICGFLLVYQVSKYISTKRNVLNQVLVYIGQRTFYVMTFHFLMFKPASYLKAYIWNMDMQVVGYLPVIPPKGDMWYWIVYAISSLVFSLMLERLVSQIPSFSAIIQKISK